MNKCSVDINKYSLKVEFKEESKSEMILLFNQKLPFMVEIDSYFNNSIQFVLRGRESTVIGAALVRREEEHYLILLLAIKVKKKGFGSILMNFIMTHLITENKENFITVKIEADETSVGFYRKMGFTTTVQNVEKSTYSMFRNLIQDSNFEVEINPKKITIPERRFKKNKARKLRKSRNNKIRKTNPNPDK
jgi:predicted GNAT family N-acyltransferase